MRQKIEYNEDIREYNEDIREIIEDSITKSYRLREEK